MEAAVGSLHDQGAGAIAGRPIVVDSIVVGVEARTLLNVLERRETKRNVERQSFKRQSGAGR